MKLILLLVFSCFLTSLAMAQDFPRSEFFGGYSYLRTDSEDVDLSGLGAPGVLARRDNGNLNGFNVGITGNFNQRIGIVGDVSGHFGKIDTSVTSLGVTTNVRVKTQLYNVLFGPQYYFADGKFKPFARAMVGFAHIDETVVLNGVKSSDDETAFAAGFGGGIDYKFSDKVSARLFQVDFILTRFDGGGVANDTQKALRVSTGFVFRN